MNIPERRMKEKAFEEQVKKFLMEQGCWVLKTWSNGIQREGVPDLLVCCNGFFLGIELKADNGHPSDLQLWNIDWFRKAGGFAMVLYPKDFAMLKDLILDLKEGIDIDWWLKHQQQFDKGVNEK